MSTTNAQFVHQMYITYLQRPAEPAGHAFWVGELEAGVVTREELAAQFGGSEEFAGRFTEANRAELINEVYQALFGRDAEEEGLAFWMSEETDIALLPTVIAAASADWDGATLQNRLTFAEKLMENLTQEQYESVTQEQLREMLSNVTEDTEVTDEFVKDVVAGVELGDDTDTSELTEALTALESAREAQSEAADGVEEKFEALAAAGVAGFTTGTFSTDDLEDYELAAEAAILSAQTTLNGARSVATDGALNQALQAAQAKVDQDTGRYNEDGVDLFQDPNGAVVRVYASTDDISTGSFTWSTTADATNSKFVGYALTSAVGGDQSDAATNVSSLEDGNYTAKQLQNFISSTLAAYEGHVTAQGKTEALVAELKDAIGLYLNQNADVAALSGALTAAITTYQASAKDHAADAALYDAVKTAYDAIYTGGTSGDESTLADNTRGEAVEALLEALEKRNELSDAYDSAVIGFTKVDSDQSFGFNSAKADVEVRDGLIEAVAAAQTNAEELAQLIEAYNTASDDVAAADEALGYSIEDLDEAVEFGTEDDDLFILDLESLDGSSIGEVSILDAAAGDIIFFGSSYALGNIDAADNNALEVFLVADGANTVVTVETEEFGSNTGDTIEVTLVGVSFDSVSFEDGVLSIA